MYVCGGFAPKDVTLGAICAHPGVVHPTTKSTANRNAVISRRIAQSPFLLLLFGNKDNARIVAFRVVPKMPYLLFTWSSTRPTVSDRLPGSLTNTRVVETENYGGRRFFRPTEKPTTLIRSGLL
jgi:hypothetical protein